MEERLSRCEPRAFKSDAVIREFGSVDRDERPEVKLGIKEILYVELRARGASTDAHP